MRYFFEIGVLTIVFLLCGCSKVINKQREEQPIVVKTIIVSGEPSATTGEGREVSRRYVGTIDAERETPLSMQVSGRVLRVTCRDGEHVRAGQVLLCVDSTQAVNALRSAEAALRQAEDAYNRVKQVHAGGAVSDQQMVEVESKLEQARAMESAALKQVEECVLSAPTDGTVSALEVKVGQTIVPGVRVLNLLNVSSYKVSFAVPESEVGSVAIGQSGRMHCAATNEDYAIRVCEKNLKANPVAHTYTIKANVTGNSSRLMPGMVATVMLPQREVEHIIVPATCIHLLQSGASVWLMRDGHAERVMVEVGGYEANGIRIKSGLNDGDSVVVEGYQKIYEGCKLTSEN